MLVNEWLGLRLVTQTLKWNSFVVPMRKCVGYPRVLGHDEKLVV